MKKIQAIYIHKDYNAFEELDSKRGKSPYEIIANVPDDWTEEQIYNEANKESAKRDGYELRKIKILDK